MASLDVQVIWFLILFRGLATSIRCMVYRIIFTASEPRPVGGAGGSGGQPEGGPGSAQLQGRGGGEHIITLVDIDFTIYNRS